jgi:N-acetylneuraminic acid mutarotase
MLMAMLRTLLTSAFHLCILSLGWAQSNTWSRKNDVAYNGQDGPTSQNLRSFSVGNIGYILLNNGPLWAYEPALDTWTPRTAFPVSGSNYPVTMGLNGYGYAFLTSGTMETWIYDPSINTWSMGASFPGASRSGAIGFTVSGKAYVGLGGGLTDLWEYNPILDQWTAKANYPISGLDHLVSFSIGSMGYCTGGCSSCGAFPEFPQLVSNTYAFDPVANTWLPKAAGPNAGYGRIAFAVDNKGYVGMGGTTWGGATNAIQAYDAALDAWTPQPTFGYSVGRANAFTFVIGNKAYIGAGGKYGGYQQGTFNDFWEFDPQAQTYTPRCFVGGMAVDRSTTFAVGNKATYIRGGRLGQYSWSPGEVWDYTPATDTWTRRNVLNPNRVGAASFAIQGMGYKAGGFANGGYTSTEFIRHDTVADSWTYMANLIPQRYGAVAFSFESRGYVGLGLTESNGIISYRNDLQRYDPVTNTWTAMAQFPGTARGDAIGFRIGNKFYVGTGFSGTYHSDMWMYDIAQNTWTQKANFGGTPRRGAVAFTLGGKGYVSTGMDGTRLKDLWEYDPITDIWTQKADFGGVGRSNAFVFTIGPRAYVGNGATGTSTFVADMWEYTAVDPASAVQVRPKVFLDGPYITGTGLMNDALRTAGLVPLTEPYTALGYDHAMSGGETTSPAVLSVTGNNAIVDWVMVELRHATQPALVVASACALVQRDGDVVAVDGSSPVRLFVDGGNYHVAIRHRNHLGVMTANAIALSPTASTVDLTSSATTVHGIQARKAVGAVQVLWPGDATRNGILSYTGMANDRDPILLAIGGSTPTSSITGYRIEDTNLDGVVKYTGSANDRDVILLNIGGTVPTSLRLQQLP